MSATLIGQKRLQQQLRRIGRSLQGEALGESLTHGTALIVEDARRRAPVGETGRLSREGIDHDLAVSRRHEAESHIGWTREAYYGSFVEFGTRDQGPQPHLRPAFIEREQAVVQDVRKSWRDLIRRAARRG